MTLIVVIVGSLLLGVGVVWLLYRIGARERQRTERQLAAIAGLSVSEARAMALEALADPVAFTCEPAVATPTDARLPATVQELFSRYQRVESGEFCLSQSYLSEPPRLAGCIKIGQDFEFEEIVLRAGSDTVYSSYGDAPPDESPEP